MIRNGMTQQSTRSRAHNVKLFLILGMGFGLFGCLPSGTCGAQPVQAEWIRPGEEGGLIWGRRGGVVIAVWPSGFRAEGLGGPRGLFRVGYERDGQMRLINFIAVEPVVGDTRGFSELEPSSVAKQDKPSGPRRGKLIWPWSEYPPPTGANRPNTIEDMRRLSVTGWLSRPSPTVEQLNITFDVEKFDNGAHPWVVASIRSDQPEEVIFTVHAAPDSEPMDRCILTATMGNYIRARRLWLRGRVVYSKALWPDPVSAGVGRAGFTRPEFFEEASMCRLRDGSLIAAITTDEDDPSKVLPKLAPWRYQGRKVTQYWKTHPHGAHPIRIRVNGRFTYWMSHSPIPNGVAYENFELVQDYFDAQQFIFGVTEQTPAQFGLTVRPPVRKDSQGGRLSPP